MALLYHLSLIMPILKTGGNIGIIIGLTYIISTEILILQLKGNKI